MIEIKTKGLKGGTDVSLKVSCENAIMFCEEALAIIEGLHDDIKEVDTELHNAFLIELAKLVAEWKKDNINAGATQCVPKSASLS